MGFYSPLFFHPAYVLLTLPFSMANSISGHNFCLPSEGCICCDPSSACQSSAVRGWGCSLEWKNWGFYWKNGDPGKRERRNLAKGNTVPVVCSFYFLIEGKFGSPIGTNAIEILTLSRNSNHQSLQAWRRWLRYPFTPGQRGYTWYKRSSNPGCFWH